MPVRSPELARLTQPRPDVRGDHALRVRSILRLQQTIGNREVVRLMASPPDAPLVCQAESLPAVPWPPVAATWSAAHWRQRLSLIWGRFARRRAVAGKAEPPHAIEGQR
jgi:hypothetical protein